MKLYAALCTIFSARQEANGSISELMRNRALRGNIDEPRKIAILTELLKRVAQIEEDIAVLKDVLPPVPQPKINFSSEDMKNIDEIINKTLGVKESLSWTDLRHKAKELGVFKPGLKRQELEALIASKSS